MAEASRYLDLWCKILQFYFKNVRQFGKIHPDMPSGKLLSDLNAAPLPHEVVLGADFAHEFNDSYEVLKKQIAAAVSEPNYNLIWTSCFAVRAFQCFVVWTYGWQLGLLAGLLQFVMAPLSLTSSFIRLFTNVSDCIVHYAFNFLAYLMCTRFSSSLPWLPKVTVTVNMTFVIVFFVIDFALNLFVHVRTADGWSFGRLLMHMAYGTFNCKTYFVVVLGCLLGLQFDLMVIIVTSVLTWYCSQTGLQQKLLDLVGWPCFSITFYVEHRIGHMPRVYQHAHKMHHFLHDSTSFDAHIYGSGMNEEFFWILAETLPCLLFPGMLFPYFLDGTTIYSSWTNKGAHARTAPGVTLSTFGVFDEDNYHADHHTWHRANFGSSITPLIDFYFGTTCPGLKGSNGRLYNLQTDPENKSLLRVRLEAPTNREAECRSAAPVQSQEVHAVVEEGAPATAAAATADGQEWNQRVVSMAELQSKKGGPWVAVHGGVFDLSAFQRIHPGGAEVLHMYGGTDATKTFDEIGHSDKAKAMARKRLVGVLEGQPLTDFVAVFASAAS